MQDVRKDVIKIKNINIIFTSAYPGPGPRWRGQQAERFFLTAAVPLIKYYFYRAI